MAPSCHAAQGTGNALHGGSRREARFPSTDHGRWRLVMGRIDAKGRETPFQAWLRKPLKSRVPGLGTGRANCRGTAAGHSGDRPRSGPEGQLTGPFFDVDPTCLSQVALPTEPTRTPPWRRPAKGKRENMEAQGSMGFRSAGNGGPGSPTRPAEQGLEATRSTSSSLEADEGAILRRPEGVRGARSPAREPERGPGQGKRRRSRASGVHGFHSSRSDSRGSPAGEKMEGNRAE